MNSYIGKIRDNFHSFPSQHRINTKINRQIDITIPNGMMISISMARYSESNLLRYIKSSSVQLNCFLSLMIDVINFLKPTMKIYQLMYTPICLANSYLQNLYHSELVPLLKMVFDCTVLPLLNVSTAVFMAKLITQNSSVHAVFKGLGD